MTYFYGESAGELRPVARGPTETERARNRGVEIFAPSKPPPLPQPVTPATTHTVRIVGRSSILPVGPRLGTISCPISVRRVVQDALIPGGALSSLIPKLAAFGALLDRAVKDHIRNDAKDRMYRLYSEWTFRVICRDGAILGVVPNLMDTDVGEECLVGSACLTPPPIIVTSPTLRRVSPDTFSFGWSAKGRPHNAAEVAFQAICPRTSRYIWHNLSGTIRCTGSGVAVAVNLAGSRFPTHAVFVDGTLRASLPQGTLSQLWDPHPSDASMVR
jgi:hypothetical protein